LQIAAGLKELSLESAFTHLAQLDSSRKIAKGDIGPHAEDSDAVRTTRRVIPVERSGGGT
jgi:glycerol-3-phosphate dehydrogenase